MSEVDLSVPHSGESSNRPLKKRKLDQVDQATSEAIKAHRANRAADKRRFDLYRTPIGLKLAGSDASLPCHKELLCYKWASLAKRIGCTEHGTAKDSVFTVENMTPDMLRIALLWLYRDRVIPLPLANAAVSSQQRMWDLRGQPEDSSQGAELDDISLVELYILAFKYRTQHLKNRIIEALAALCLTRRSASAAAVNKAYAELPRECRLLQYFVDEARANRDTSNFANSASSFCIEYLSDVLRATSSPAADTFSLPDEIFDCRYHVHKLPGCCKPILATYNAPSGVDLHTWMDEFVTVFVGTHRQPFAVHKAWLCRSSNFFKSAFNGSFAEAGKRTVDLHQESVRVFRLFLTWLYTRTVRIPSADVEAELYEVTQSHASRLKSCEAGTSSDSLYTENTTFDMTADQRDSSSFSEERPDVQERPAWVYRNIIDLYAFADRRDVRVLRNEILSSLIALREREKPEWPLISQNFDLVNLAYHVLPKESCLLNYLVYQAAHRWEETEVTRSDLCALPSDFLAGMLQERQLGTWGEEAPFICTFHEHPDEANDKNCPDWGMTA